LNGGFFDTKQVNQIAAQTLVSNKDYGLAISYCLSAEDWRGVGRVVDSVLDEYVINGSAFFFHILDHPKTYLYL